MSDNIIGESGGIPGLVRIICNHLGQPIRVEIDDLVFKENDKDLVSDLFIAALNSLNDKLLAIGVEKIREIARKKGNKYPSMDNFLAGFKNTDKDSN